MPDPTLTVSIPAAGVISIMGVATGLPADIVFPAFVGALWALRSAHKGGPWWRGLQVVAGTLFAAWITPLIIILAPELLTLIFPGILPISEKVPPDVLKYPVALALGWVGLSGALKWAGEWISKRGAK